MSFLQILRSEGGDNFVTNPSFETSTTGWVTISSTISRSTTWQYRGAYSLRVLPVNGVNSGVNYDSPAIDISGVTQMYVSFWGLFPVGEKFQAIIQFTAQPSFVYNWTGTGVTQRIVFAFTPYDAIVDLNIIRLSINPGALFFYIDAVQIEKNAESTYIDGDQDGCWWAGAPHASTSVRSSPSIRSSRGSGGGRWMDWTTDLGLDLIDLQGIGMPPTENVAVPYALLPGAQFQRSLSRSRIITIIGLARGQTWQNLHELRNLLISRINPDVVTPQQPITLRYTGAGGTVNLNAYYDNGLELGPTQGFNETFALRMVAHDPYVYSEEDDGAELQVIDATESLAVLDRTGVWSDPISFTGEVLAVAPLDDGTWLVGGNFVNAGGNANADYIARYIPESGTFSAYGSGANGVVRSITVIDNNAKNPNFVIGGDFTLAGGVANTLRIARWSSSAWTALGTGAAAAVRALTHNPETGIIYAAGDFTTIGGSAINRIAAWNGSAWSGFGTGLNGAGNTLMWYNDILYVGGAFTTANGVTVNRVTYWNGSTFVSMAGGVNNTVNSIVGTTGGLIYVGGTFTTAGGINALRVAVWTGASWSPLGSGIDGTVNALTLTPDQALIVASEVNIVRPFNTSVFGAVAIWDGSTWAPFYHTDVDTNGGALSGPKTIVASGDGTICLGAATTGCRLLYGQRATVTNTGNAPASPIVVNGAYGLYNWTTGQAYYLRSPADLVDTRIGQQRIINNGISAPGLFLRGQLTITLQNGTNLISLIGNNSTGGHVYWRRRHLSADGL